MCAVGPRLFPRQTCFRSARARVARCPGRPSSPVRGSRVRFSFFLFAHPRCVFPCRATAFGEARAKQKSLLPIPDFPFIHRLRKRGTLFFGSKDLKKKRNSTRGNGSRTQKPHAFFFEKNMALRKKRQGSNKNGHTQTKHMGGDVEETFFRSTLCHEKKKEKAFEWRVPITAAG